MCLNKFHSLQRLSKFIHTEPPRSSFFYAFDTRVRGSNATFKFYKALDSILEGVPENQWPTLVEKARNVVCCRDMTKFGVFSQLHEVLFEALGFWYLQNVWKAENIQYIPESSACRTPDFVADIGNQKILCEQKTKNTSDVDDSRYYNSPSDPKPSTIPSLSRPTRESIDQILRRIVENAKSQIAVFQQKQIDYWGAERCCLIFLDLDTVYDNYFSPLLDPVQDVVDSIQSDLTVDVVAHHHQEGWVLVRKAKQVRLPF